VTDRFRDGRAGPLSAGDTAAPYFPALSDDWHEPCFEGAPIRGEALAVFARIFAAGRRVRLRGMDKSHQGPVALRPALLWVEDGPQAAGFAEERSIAA